MLTVLKMLKYELKLTKADIVDLDERMKGSDTYFKKELRRRKRNTEKYIEELIHEIELLKLRKQQDELNKFNSKYE